MDVWVSPDERDRHGRRSRVVLASRRCALSIFEGRKLMQNSGVKRRGNAGACFSDVIARRLSAEAIQSPRVALDCFASLAMTGIGCLTIESENRVDVVPVKRAEPIRDP
jgi:hypothetical protein